MSIRALSTRTGIDRGYLSRLERDLIRETTAERVEVIAQAMRVPTAAITHKEMKRRDDDGHEQEAPHRPQWQRREPRAQPR